MPKGNRGGNNNGGKSNFTQDQKDAIDYYASGDGMYINDILRERHGMNQSDLNENDKELIKDLDKALDKKVPQETLYRNVDASAIFGNNVDNYDLTQEILYNYYGNQKGEYSQNKAAQLNNAVNRVIGKTITDKGYMSTTRDAKIAENWGDFTGSSNPIVMKIKTSANTKGADISKATKTLADIEKSSPQKETLLARNQKYKVNKVYGKNGTVYVDVTMQ